MRRRVGMRLELRDEGLDGPRHYLDGKPLYFGDRLLVRLPDGRWKAVRYLERLFLDEPFPLLMDHHGEAVKAPKKAFFRWAPRQREGEG